MAVQKLETYVWGALRRPTVILEPGTVVDLSTHAELRVVNADKVVMLQSDVAEWEGLEMKSELKTADINTVHIQVEGGLADFFIGHKIVFQWVPTTSHPK